MRHFTSGRFRTGRVIAAVAALALTLGACASGTDDTADEGADDASAEDTADEDTTDEDTADEEMTDEDTGDESAAGDVESYRVGIIRWDAGDIFFNGVQAGEERQIAALEERFGIEIETSVVAANDANDQLNGLQALLAQGVDGVSLVPWRGESMVQAVQDLEERGIPAVVHNLTVPESPFPFVAFANADAGRLAGEAIVAHLEETRGEDWGADGGVIMLLRGDVTASFDSERFEGYMSVFDQVLEQFPDVEIVERAELGYQGEPARRAVEDAISRYGAENMLAVASVDGTMAVGGAIPALTTAGQETGSSGVAVTSIDCSQPELDAIADGSLTHCSEQPATAEGLLVQALLFDMITRGTTEPSDQDTILDLVDWGADVPWEPVEVLDRDDIAGPWYKTQAFAVPGDVPVDSPFHWAGDN